ncbi:MAG: lysophospholipid acyltransferase family protein [Caulobacteraceae bacterium]
MAASPPSLSRRIGWRLEALAYDIVSGLFHLLPLDWASAAGGAIMRAIGPLTGEQRVAMTNVAFAFPDLSEAERKRIVRDHWDNLGRTGVEFVLADRISVASGRIEIEGAENVLKLAREGRPAILISGHFANWEAMPAAATAHGVPLIISYRRANNPYVDKRIVDERSGGGVHLFAAKGKDGSRALIAELKKGGVLGFLNDQRDDNGVETPFFGRLVKTAPGPARMALTHGAAIVPIGVVRLKGVRFRVTAYPPLMLKKTGDRQADLTAAVAEINAFVEARIREQPGQWLWSHKRWPKPLYKKGAAETSA